MYKKQTLCFGVGKSGKAAAALLRRLGEFAVLYTTEMQDFSEIQSSEGLEDIDVVCGDIACDPTMMDRFDEIVLSPGIPLDNPMVEKFKAAGKKMIGEIELGYRYNKGKIVAITGTNGKTTTTTLVGEIMKRKYSDVKVVGNIGIPFTDTADKTTEDSVTVIEVSSFQLETIEEFHADVTAILNVTPDHLNRHHTMEKYAECKEKVTNKATASDICVLNADNSYTADFALRCPATPKMFSAEKELSEGIFLRGKDIILRENGTEKKLMNVKEMNLVGQCNAENVMAAILIGLAMDVELSDIIDTVKNFKAVEHRIEYTATKRGVRFYNDSKGTNPDAAIQAVKAMDAPTCLIGGGYDKGSEYDEWIESFDGKIKKLVLIGETADKIALCAANCGFKDVMYADSLEEAIDICYENALPGENVLLSPACASWGMFDNFEQRGNIFKEYVLKLKE